MITLVVLAFEGAVVRRSTDAAAPPVLVRGVAATVAELRRRGVRVVLVCEGPHRTAVDALAGLGWSVSGELRTPHAVDAVVAVDDVASAPPAPFAVHHAMELVGTLDVRQVLVAGDSVAMLEAGRAAGAGWVVGVLSGAARRPELASVMHDAILTDVNDLVALPVPAAPVR
ncbi:HAD family hydrolase [Agromyces kandeliae]|uniref:HAD family hydrolase n=1 Tax=Agromyces kandeliae TaxID=2666141 RepID=UPI002D21C0EF|nr:HAD family hydrolase [Agromyces kandeliae]